ncbi:hypothetical protein SVAN01_09202 [Stagonosporopsis vannaccii]|nr:hypothetical protein SVAN01_09202 [Stagonosporopsis vannaccii]
MPFLEQPEDGGGFGESMQAFIRELEGYVAAGEGGFGVEVFEGGFEAPAPSPPSPSPPHPQPPPPPPARAPVLASSSVLAPSPSARAGSVVDLHASLDNAAPKPPAARLTCSNYQPHPDMLAHNPPAPHDPNSLYTPITTSRFRSAAEAAAHRRRARLPPKNRAPDVARVKALGRDYWVCRLFNAMISSADITDGEASIHRTRFTTKAVFDPVDLEAAAHAVFDEAIAVHERGWNRPKVYHRHAVRGKLVDIAQTSVELRLSRICLVLQQTKSAVDDAVRGGVTMALLCDNPEARKFTKSANDLGNAKRGERLRETATKEKAKPKREKKPRKESKGELEADEQAHDAAEAAGVPDYAGVAGVDEVAEFAEFFEVQDAGEDEE